jgi:CxxC motif-containing protein (DUF1111 family)
MADIKILAVHKPGDDSATHAAALRFVQAMVGNAILCGGKRLYQSIANGGALFSAIGCATCHNPTVGNTQPSHITGSLSNAPVNAFSDLEIHHMGGGLADNVSQGGAGGDQFRTAPLWGLGQRIFLLHDGRTTDLIKAIDAHESRGSEANRINAPVMR